MAESLPPADTAEHDFAAESIWMAIAGLRKALVDHVNALTLPPNVIDDLIDRFNGPKYVAEMTGRKSRFVRVGANPYGPLPTADAPAPVINEKRLEAQPLVVAVENYTAVRAALGPGSFNWPVSPGASSLRPETATNLAPVSNSDVITGVAAS
jgi:hypothetical protein